MTLIGGFFVLGLSQRNFKAVLIKQSSELTEDASDDIKIHSYEIYMMAYLWSCCLRSKKFKEIRNADAKVSKSLNIAQLFKAVDSQDQVGGLSDQLKAIAQSI